MNGSGRGRDFIRAGWGPAGLACLVLFSAGGCGKRDRAPVLVFAASSVADVVVDLAAEFEAQGRGKIRVSAGASIDLKRQIEAGAPADLFLSAASDPVDELVAKGHVDPVDRIELLGNRLALVVSRSRDPGLQTWHDLQQPSFGRLAIGDPLLVPAGRYAQEALRHLGLWTIWEPRLAPAPNVRAVLAYVESGAADAGIVYLTDARVSGRVRTAFLFPPEAHRQIVYSTALLRRSSRPTAARDFLGFLLSAPSRRRFAEAGFQVLGAELSSR
jgi:molybdate transport system substrate-binding protein